MENSGEWKCFFLMIVDSQTPDNLFALIWVSLDQMPGASLQKGVSQKIAKHFVRETSHAIFSTHSARAKDSDDISNLVHSQAERGKTR